MSSLSKNIFYSSFLAISNYIFPLLVYPYVSRVLGVSNIGICNFVDSIIHYFILFSMMGISIIGTREISNSRNSREKLDRKYSSLLSLNAIMTTVALIFLAIATFTVDDLSQHKWMMGFGGIKIISNFFLVEWFYRGIEQFRFITIRTIIIKCLFVASVYIFVSEPSDYWIYYLLTTLMVTLNAIVNIIYSTRYVKFRIRVINFTEVAKPFFILGLYMLITSMCTTFNTAYLGFVTDNTEVGYYSTATKLYTILLALFTGATTAIMPHMTTLLASNDKNKFKEILLKASYILLSFSIPVIIFSIIFAPDIVSLISGKGYEGAILPMQIVMPLMLIIGYEQIIVIQGLMPLAKDKIVMKNALTGAVVSIILNVLLVSRMKSVGSAISWFCSESVILILSQIAFNKYINFPFPWKYLFKSLIAYSPLAGILLILSSLNNIAYEIKLTVSCLITIIFLIIAQVWYLKNPTVIKSINLIKQKFKL